DWCVLGELVPGYLLVRRGAGVRAVGRRRIADLAEVGPGLHGLAEVVLDRGHDADGEVARDAAADLEEADARALRELLVLVVEGAHVLDAGLGDARAHLAVLDVAREDVAE